MVTDILHWPYCIPALMTAFFKEFLLICPLVTNLLCAAFEKRYAPLENKIHLLTFASKLQNLGLSSLCC